MIIISEKYEARNSNCTSFSRGNLVDGLPLGRSWQAPASGRAHRQQAATGGVRVFLAGTRLTVHRRLAIWNRLGTPMGKTPQLLSVEFCDENRKLFARSQLCKRTRTKG